MIADFGGQVGLWLGLSMIAVFELVELIADLIMICVRRLRDRQKAKREERAQNGGKWASPSSETSFVKPEATETANKSSYA